MTVNEIFRQYGPAFQKAYPFLTVQEKKVINAIAKCRTPELGGHLEVCEECGHSVLHYHSCRNRHCPQCQSVKKEQWIEDRKQEVFPFQYFHVVFTLPDVLNPIVYRNKTVLYNLLFQKVKETVLSTGKQEKYFGARMGFFSILHTWGQKLNLHPHLHCVVPGGGYDEKAGIWKKSPRDYLFPVEVLKKRFRSLFLIALKELYNQKQLYTAGTQYHNRDEFQTLIDKLFHTEWVVYLKESFRSSDSVIRYLGKYTHRIAISNYRISKMENEKVYFWYKDYKDNSRKKILCLPVFSFMKQFLLHVLPKRLVRIRYYGIVSNRNKGPALESCYEFFHLQQKVKELSRETVELIQDITGIDPLQCPKCGSRKIKQEEIPPVHERAPPIRIA